MSDFAGDFVLPTDPTTPETTTPERTTPDQAIPDPASQHPAQSLSAPQPASTLEGQRRTRVPNFETINIPSPRNPAVDRCIQAAALGFKEAYDSGLDGEGCLDMARVAYFAAMPSPCYEYDTRTFVACVTHGMLTNIINPDLGSRLLYAAQVALTGTNSRNR